ncbi:hypothetical protein BX600DRAFT_519857, partial [Xylariales sp. PMI_506]
GSFSICFFFVGIFQCSPVSYYWLRVTHEISGKCADATIAETVTYMATAIHAWSDWTLGLLPVFLVWKLQIKQRAKLSINGILALGILSVPSVSIPPAGLEFYLKPYANMELHILGVGLVASSIATLRPLFKRGFGRTGDDSYPLGPSDRKASAGAKLSELISQKNANIWKDDHSPAPGHMYEELDLLRPKELQDKGTEWEQSSKDRPVSTYDLPNS